MSDSPNPIRIWRLAKDLSLEEACALFVERGYQPPSTAKLSRIERGQPVPVEMLAALSALTGIPARELRPDLAALFDAEAA
ncbi:MAG: helix-turn-helix transcriptional regulator [Rhizobiales bacterium]|nr:helix-turn-helix transcriptional regulator [Hyphomicrobiales bacterium]